MTIKKKLMKKLNIEWIKIIILIINKNELTLLK